MNIRFGWSVAPGSLGLALPSRRTWPVALVFGLFFLVFAAIEWSTVSHLRRKDADDVFDLAFFLFQAFWALGWAVGVAILGALTMLVILFRESAELTSRSLVYVPRLGPLAFPVEYDLTRVRNPRLENDGADTARVLFDYDGRPATLGNAMPLAEGGRIVDLLRSSIVDRPTIDSRPSTIDRSSPIDNRPSTIDDDRRWTMADRRWTIFSLVAANLVPAIGVIFLKWSISSLLLLFWVESGVIGLYTVLKIAVVGRAFALLAAPFFVGHFGGFMTMHFLFIYAFFIRGIDNTGPAGVAETFRTALVPLRVSVAMLAVSHGISFFANFLGRREYQSTSVAALMSAPYSRIMLMQIVLIVGGWVVMLVGSPTVALLLLIALKTAVDLRAHLREHR